MKPSEQPAKMPDWIFPLLLWIVSLYFLIGFLKDVGFPPDRNFTVPDTPFGIVGIFFLFLPFFKKIKIGKLLELEREVARAKEELKEFKAEVRSSVNVLSTNANSNRINFYYKTPSVPEIEEEGRVLEAKAPSTANAALEVERNLLQQGDDIIVALFKTRVEIERLLRTIVGKSTSLPPGKENIRMAGLIQLFQLFIAQHPQYKYLQKSLRYVNQVCSAAIHAQQVSEDQAREVLALGTKIIATLEDFAGETPADVQ